MKKIYEKKIVVKNLQILKFNVDQNMKKINFSDMKLMLRSTD